MKGRRIGILGGSFNPVHFGHLVLAEQARAVLGLEKVIFVPANIPPHKQTKDLALGLQRLKMLSLALKSNPAFALSDCEIRRGGVSYSLETVKFFRARIKGVGLYFIVGSDFLREFSRWKDLHKMGKLCKFILARRPGYALKKSVQAVPLRTIEITALDISSTAIRRRVKNKQTIRYLVPEQVRKYILDRGLYR